MTFWMALLIVVASMVALWGFWFVLQWVLGKLSWADDPPFAAAGILLPILVVVTLAFAMSHPDMVQR